MNKQTMLEELENIRFKSMSEGKFPTDLNQFSRFCELLNAIIERLPDDSADEGMPAESDTQMRGEG